MVLVGTDIESRADPEIVHGLFVNGSHDGPVLHEEGERLAKEIGASKYLECSLGDRGQVKQVFEEVRDGIASDSHHKLTLKLTGIPAHFYEVVHMLLAMIR